MPPAFNSCERDIAIVSARCRFPGAPNLNAFWRLLVEGRVSIRALSAEELRSSGVAAEELASPHYLPYAGVLDSVFDFDPGYFGFSPLEARALDVQQRLLLDECASLLEQAGYEDPAQRASVGVFATSASSTYLEQVRADPAVCTALGDLLLQQAHDKDYVATRLAHKLDLRGPAVSVQSACSSGLVAVHMACQSLMLAECDLAIACAAAVRLPQHRGYVYKKNGILARDGQCRPLGPGASGTVFSNGVAAVLLKRLDDALRDGDQVLAVIKGSAINNDGAAKVGFAAPSVSGQAAVMATALARAGLAAADVSFIEMHATGTQVGDPLELESVRRIYGPLGPQRAIGSAKGNIGHTGHAAGLAGLLKAALMLSHRRMVGTAGGASPDCEGGKAADPAGLLREAAAWPSPDGAARSCAVSAFGIGGTNAHVVLQEAPSAPVRVLQRRPRAVLVSARDELALLCEREAMAAQLKSARSDEDFARIAFTSQVGRRHLKHRCAVVADGAAQAADALEQPGSRACEDPAVQRWLEGGHVDWVAQWRGEQPRRGGLPPRLRRPEHLQVQGQGQGEATALAAPPRQVPAAAFGGALDEPSVRQGIDAIFRQFLGIPEVDPDASFFDLGGDSLMAVDLLEEVGKTFGLALATEALYSHSSVRALAAHVHRQALERHEWNCA